MTPAALVAAHAISILAALGLALVAWRWKNVGRLLLVALLLWAGQLNLRLAIQTPQVYTNYAEWAWAPYRRFILGSFAAQITPLVAAIAVGQLAVAVLIALRGRAVYVGLGGAIVFFVAIAPLGVGSAFPSTLLLALAAALLLGARYPETLPAALWHALAPRQKVRP